MFYCQNYKIVFCVFILYLLNATSWSIFHIRNIKNKETSIYGFCFLFYLFILYKKFSFNLYYCFGDDTKKQEI